LLLKVAETNHRESGGKAVDEVVRSQRERAEIISKATIE
jgi:hypothetical protein